MASQRQETDYGGSSAGTSDETLKDTAESGWDETQQWPMDHIMHEAYTESEGTDGQIRHKKKYLVKWTGYSKYKATWEPEESFANLDDVLFPWQEESMRRLRGDIDPFDFLGFEEEKVAITHKRARRHERRNKKRRRQGLPEVVYQDYEEDADDEEEGERSSKEDEMPTSRGVRRREADALSGLSDSDDRPARKRRLNDANEKPPKKAKKRRAMPVSRTVESSSSSSSRSSSPRRQPQRPPATKNSAKPTQRKHNEAPKNTAARATRSDASKSVTQAKGINASAPLPRMPWHTSATYKAATANERPNATATTAAPTARMVRRGPATKVTAHRVTSGGSHVFANFNGVTTSSPRKPGTRSSFHSLQHRYRAQKKDASEAVPKLDTLNLYDPKSGKVVSRSASQTSPTPVIPSSDLFHSPGPALDFDVTRPSTRVSITPPPQQSLNTQDGQLTCWFWLNFGSCRFAHECGLAHSDTGNYVFKNKSSTLITCPHWVKGNCKRREEECTFAHHKTRYIATIGSALVREISVTDGDGAWRQSGTQKAPFLPKKDQTCWFWYNEKCNKSADHCAFSHEMRSFMAARGGGPLIPTAKLPQKLPNGDFVDPAQSDALSPRKEADSNWGTTSIPEAMSRSPSPAPIQALGTPQSVVPFAFHHGDQLAKQSDLAQDIPRGAIEVTLRAATTPAEGTFDIKALLLGMDRSALNMFRHDAGFSPSFDISHCWVLEAVRDLFDLRQYTTHADGDIIGTQTTTSQLENFAENLKNSSAAGVAFTPSFIFIFYPPGPAAYGAFDRRPNTHKNTSLHFKMLSTVGPVYDLVSLNTRTHAPSKPDPTMVSTPRLDESDIFGYFSGPLNENAFLMFPSKGTPRQDALIDALQTIGATVYRSGDPGSWDYFCNTASSGAVIIDSSLYQVHKLPRIRDLLNGQYNFFTYGPLPVVFGDADSSLDLSDQSTKPQDPSTALHKLLPQGQAVYILDSCFKKHPKSTLNVVKSLLERIKHIQMTRILGRPDLVAWLLEVGLSEHEAEKNNLFGQGSELWKTHLDLHSELNKLLQSNYEYMDRAVVGKPAAPSADHSPLFFLPKEDWPSYYAELGKGQERADNHAVDWFGAWSLMNALKLRKFVVVTDAQEKVVEAWERKWMHISFSTPQKYAERSKRT